MLQTSFYFVGRALHFMHSLQPLLFSLKLGSPAWIPFEVYSFILSLSLLLIINLKDFTSNCSFIAQSKQWCRFKVKVLLIMHTVITYLSFSVPLMLICTSCILRDGNNKLTNIGVNASCSDDMSNVTSQSGPVNPGCSFYSCSIQCFTLFFKKSASHFKTV